MVTGESHNPIQEYLGSLEHDLNRESPEPAGV